MCPTSGISNAAKDLSLLQSASALLKPGCGDFCRRMYVFFAAFWAALGNLIGWKYALIGWGA